MLFLQPLPGIADRKAKSETLVYSGPIFKGKDLKGNKVVLHFDHVGRGLEARGGELKGFSICGEDHRFYWGRARIEGDTVVVMNPEIAEPVAVRYGWADFPVINLWNKNGLPASPFRTDNFPITTQPKKQKPSS